MALEKSKSMGGHSMRILRRPATLIAALSLLLAALDASSDAGRTATDRAEG